MRQRQDQPVLRDDLHPRADARGARAEPLHAEVAVGEGREHAREGAYAERGGRRGGRGSSVPGRRIVRWGSGGFWSGRGGHDVSPILPGLSRASAWGARRVEGLDGWNAVSLYFGFTAKI